MIRKDEKEAPKPKVSGQVPQNSPKQGSPQQVTPRSMPDKNAQVQKNSPSDKVKEIIRTMAADITALRKENAELKAKLSSVQKKP